jgi:integrase
MYQQKHAKVLRTICGDVSLRAISPLMVDQHKSHRPRGHSPVTVNAELRGLRAAFNAAVRLEYIEKNPFGRLKLASVSDKAPSFISKADFQKLTEAINDPWLKNIVLFAVLTGFRLGEIVHLQWSQVDLDRKVITVVSTDSFKTKQGKRRVVPLADPALNILQTVAQTNMFEFVFAIGEGPVSGS